MWHVHTWHYVSVTCATCISCSSIFITRSRVTCVPQVSSSSQSDTIKVQWILLERWSGWDEEASRRWCCTQTHLQTRRWRAILLCQVHFHIVSIKIPTISSQRFIFTLLSPSKSPQYPPKSKSEHETACVQSMFPAFKRFRLEPCMLRHSQKGTIEDGGTVRGNIISSMIYDIT